MNTTSKVSMSTALTVSIALSALYIVHSFIPSMVWAGIISIATYPLYRRWKACFGRYENLAAFIFTFLLGLVFILPLSWLITLLVQETQIFVNYLQTIHREGGEAPAFLSSIPLVGQTIVAYWNEYAGQPGHLTSLVSDLHISLAPASYYAKKIGVNLAHRSIQVGFTLLTLFFFYRDGDRLFAQINSIGQACLDKRWFRYVDQLPMALRATVNGTIFVGIGVGCCMGICYALLGLPTPTLTGFFTAFASMIPFAVPLVFLGVALIFLIAGKGIAAMIVIAWGTLVMFVADHFIKPTLIGGAIKLPFLAVLFGILGGLESLGLLGLFVGPMIMVLFITLCREFQGKK
ncbi:MAG: AI-2E family transporter [Methylococcales bacterium]|nr:AI-2E family transporter [Methylococcales bacterium]